MGVSFTKHSSHFGCVFWFILLLCWFSIQWPVFSRRTLNASFFVLFLSWRTYVLKLFLHNPGTDCLYLQKLVFSHHLPHLSKVICLLISLTLDKDISVPGGRWEAFLDAVLTKLWAISFSTQNCCLFAPSGSSYNQYVKSFALRFSKRVWFAYFSLQAFTFVFSRGFMKLKLGFTLILLTAQFWLYCKNHWLENAVCSQSIRIFKNINKQVIRKNY